MEKKKVFNVSEKRWVIRELEAGRLSMSEACDLIDEASSNPPPLIYYWKKKYAPGIAVTLPVMTEKERQKLDAAHKPMKTLEKQVEDAQIKNIALETMIDIPEEELRISIKRTKSKIDNFRLWIFNVHEQSLINSSVIPTEIIVFTKAGE